MVQYYGGSASSSASPSSAPTLADYSGKSKPGGPNSDAFDDVGKTSIDIRKLPGSIGDALGSLGDLGGGLLGGAAGVVGSIGIPGGPTLGDIPGAIGAGLGAVGSIPLPYLGNDPTRTNATLGDVPGAALDVVGAAGKFVEREVGAKYRVQSYLDREQRAADFRATFHRDPTPDPEKDLPPDIAAALDSGQITVDQAADMLVERGAGYTNNPAFNLVGEMILDPLNLIAPGAGAVAREVKGAGLALKAGTEIADLGLPKAFAGTLYNTASKGMSAAGQGFMGTVLGPTTKGIFHSLGTKPYQQIVGGLAKISDEYATRFSDALAKGAAQFPRAVIARHLADEADLALKTGGEEALSRFPRGADLEQAVTDRLTAKRAIDPAALERQVEDMADRVVPQFRRYSQEQLNDETARKLAQITGASPEDALRSLGGKVSREQARQVHLAFYGKAGDDLARAKALASTAKNIDAERITIIAPDTLTTDRADELLALMDAGDANAVVDAIGRYDILARKFKPADADWAKVRKYIENLKNNDALPSAVKKPKTGKNALPSALGEWRKTYEPFGYELGFAPKDGWKAIVDEAGGVTISDPFVHFVSEADPLTMRNPIGRMVDSLFRGVTQTKIVNVARNRFLDETTKIGLPDAEAERVFGAVLNEARERNVTPRGLGILGTHEYDRIFADALGDEAFKELRKKTSPVFLVMKAFEGNLAQVGLTQKFTGAIKRIFSEVGNIPAGIAEGIYPLYKFKYRPEFQLQEAIETPFWNTLRGAHMPTVSEPASRIMMEMANIGPEFRYMTEAGYVTHLIGDDVAKRLTGNGSRIGEALARVIPEGGIKGIKERGRITQVFAEHGDYFKASLDKVSPRLWKTMSEAYGTTNPGEVAQRFIEERFRLVTDKTGEAIRPLMAKGASADEETVMQAFLESWRQSSKQAFKTHYFNPERGFLERTINHPYLGLYPASYMWGKVAPEFARFLLLKPFGYDAPLVGLNAYTRVQEEIVAAQATDPKMAQYLKDHPDAIYMVQMLLPGLPEDIPVNAPAWARHLAKDNLAGKPFDPEKFVAKEGADMITHASPARDVVDFTKATGDLVDVAGDIFANLTKAAQEYDGQFSPPKPTPSFQGLLP